MAKSDLEMKIVSIAMSKKKGTPKVQVGEGLLSLKIMALREMPTQDRGIVR